jgi:hypothetical protein
MVCFLAQFKSVAQQTTLVSPPDSVIDAKLILKEIADLNSKFNTLRVQDSILKSSIWASDKSEYERAFTTVSFACQNSLDISNRFRITRERIQVDKAFLELANAQNIAGNNMQKIIIDNAAQMFEKQGEEVKGKTWKNVVSRIVKNDFVASILKSNPVGLAVNSVINFASSLIDNKLNVNGRNPVLEIDAAIGEEKIAKFKDSMKEYLEFFQRLEEVNTRFKYKIEEIDRKYSTLNDTLILYDRDLTNMLQANKYGGEKYKAASVIFNYDLTLSQSPESDILFFRKILEKEKVKNTLLLANQWKPYKQFVDSFEAEYRLAIVQFMSEYDYLFLFMAENREQTLKKMFDNNQLQTIQKSLRNAIEAHKISPQEILTGRKRE